MLKTIRALQTSAKRTAAAASSFLLLQVCSVSAYANTGEHSIFSADEIKEGTAVVGDNLLIAAIVTFLGSALWAAFMWFDLADSRKWYVPVIGCIFAYFMADGYENAVQFMVDKYQGA